MKSINLIILLLMAVLPNYAYGNQLQQQNNQEKKCAMNDDTKQASLGCYRATFTLQYCHYHHTTKPLLQSDSGTFVM